MKVSVTDGKSKINGDHKQHNGIKEHKKRNKKEKKRLKEPSPQKSHHKHHQPIPATPSSSGSTLANDEHLLREINQRKHFTFKGKAMKVFDCSFDKGIDFEFILFQLYNVCVNVANIKPLLPPSTLVNLAPVRLELLRNAYK